MRPRPRAAHLDPPGGSTLTQVASRRQCVNKRGAVNFVTDIDLSDTWLVVEDDLQAERLPSSDWLRKLSPHMLSFRAPGAGCDGDASDRPRGR